MKIKIEPGGWVVIALVTGGLVYFAASRLAPATAAAEDAPAAAASIEPSKPAARAPKPASTAPLPSAFAPGPETDRAKATAAHDVIRMVHFALDSDELRSADIAVLEQAAEELRRDRTLTVVIVGATDNTGVRDYNMVLSQKRAESAARYLRAHNIDSKRVRLRWHGPDHPVGENSTPQGRSRNRRAEIRLAPNTSNQ
jgi:outer membrane protein OmpA-like peptidoglycan-associated protein